MDNTFMLSLGLFILVPCLILGISALIRRRRGPDSAPVSVVSHRLELGIGGGAYGDNWNRLIRFRLADGSEIELYCSREDYEVIEDGQTGLLTWEDETLLHFDPDIP